jgi:hypothetical protein
MINYNKVYFPSLTGFKLEVWLFAAFVEDVLDDTDARGTG